VSSQHNEATAPEELRLNGARQADDGGHVLATAGQPDTSQPDAGQPDAGQPDTGQPDAGQPDASQPDIGQPDTGQRGAAGQFGRPLAPDARRPWKVTGGQAVFRRLTPVALWWIWVAFVIFNVIQIVIPDHDYFSLEMAAGLAAVTGLAYATGFRPRVIATEDRIEVKNPVREHVIRWGALTGVFLGDSVEFACARAEPLGEKTVYCWALYSGRRSRMKSQQLGVRSWMRNTGRAPSADAQAEDATQLMAAELGRRSTQAREAGAPAATLESRWAWLPVAYMVVPLALLIVLLAAR